jgi:hypothetical protein
MMKREEAKEFMRNVLTGHNEICTHNHYADAMKAIDLIYDDFDATLEKVGIKKMMQQSQQEFKWIDKGDAIKSLCYVEGFLNGIFQEHGEHPHCRRQLGNLWSYIDCRITANS